MIMTRTFALILIIILAVSCREDRSSESPAIIPENQSKSSTSIDTLNNLLKVENPVPGQLIESPLEITGEARGYWFFEANATLELLDGNRDQISETFITAIGEWMTEDWVPFSGTMIFEKPLTHNGFLIFHKANASGLEEHAMSDTIPVRFRK